MNFRALKITLMLILSQNAFSTHAQVGMYRSKKMFYSLYFIEKTDSVWILAKRGSFGCSTTYQRQGKTLLVDLTNCEEEFIPLGKRLGYGTIKVRNEYTLIVNRKRFKKRKKRKQPEAVNHF